MLSILIPTYNYVCVDLVRTLQKQAEALSCPYEILVADDASAEACKSGNRAIGSLPFCRFIELPENVGRARIRNLLGGMARYDWLLFMDSDAVVVKDDFLSCYLNVCGQAKVICGGISHPDRMPSFDVSLRFRYEKWGERYYTLERRQKHPYKIFRTFNFMVERSVFLAHPFDETIVKYGYEDTLFGKELEESGIGILHIDNPLLNGDLEGNLCFIHKTEESLCTLYENKEKLAGFSGVLSLYDKLERMKCVRVVAFVFRRMQNILKRNLTGKHPDLHLYAFYKIGYFCHIAEKGI